MDPNSTPVSIKFDELDSQDTKHFNQFIIYKAEWVLIAVFSFLFCIVFLQFFSRYVLNDSVAWTEEAARYLLIITAFIGAIRCQIKGTHIALEFMDKYYGSYHRAVQFFAHLLVLILIVSLIFSSITMIERTSFQHMVSLPFPKYYLYIIVASLLTINAVVLSYQLISFFQKGEDIK